MRIVFICLLFFSLPMIAISQKNYLLKLDQLDARVKNGGDTTFVINFWATWCGPCVAELPNFEKLNSEHKTEKIKVILVSVNFRSKLETDLIPFINKKKLRSEVFLLDENDQQQYIDRIDSAWSGSIPATLFIKNGKRRFFEKEFTYPDLLKEYKQTTIL